MCSPRYDTKPYWEIIRELAKRLDLGRFFPYETIEDIWNLQLKDLGVKIDDFNAKGLSVSPKTRFSGTGKRASNLKPHQVKSKWSPA